MPPTEVLRCGPLRREADGRWFFESIYLGRDDEPLLEVRHIEAKSVVVAATLADALRQACDQLETWGDVAVAGKWRALLGRFERWRRFGTWS